MNAVREMNAHRQDKSCVFGFFVDNLNFVNVKVFL